MEEICNLISGASHSGKARKFGSEFSFEERHSLIREYLSTNMSKRDIWEKYTGSREEHGQLLQWIRRFGYQDKDREKPCIFAAKNIDMDKTGEDNLAEKTFEALQLKTRIEELEQQLKDAEMKSIAYSTMIDIAEKELNIKIRKKYNSKPSNK